ncbi:MAG TPA: BTAD domain-containing putative transcriptional regulator [Gemmatimonadaceae bacterium]|nr:BTAD domain-containing putative transcriptional regulator [Gemmatimonadaceae bacterium]
MVEIHLLGGLAVTGLPPTAARALLARPQLVALLACLAMRPGFRRRDTLVGLLWPETDQARARARLRKALFQLRRALGEEAVINRGAEEVALATDHVTSDADHFESALATGQDERALELYRGELLPGFFLAVAPEWEHWLEGERRRLRELARAAALRLARECATREDPLGAVRWAREACRVAPEDEPAARELLRTLVDHGDRAGALRHYDRFARLLDQELGIQPSGEMRAFAAALRERSDGGPTLTAAASPPATMIDRAILAIVPFVYNGQATLDYLATGIADLLATAIDGSESLRCVHSGSIPGDAESSSDTECCRAMGERFDATYCVVGRVIESAGQLRISAVLYATAHPGVPLVRAGAEGGVDDLFALVDHLAAQVLVRAIGVPDRPLVGLAALTTRSLPALKSYLDGELAFRAGRFTVAAEGFQRATREDPTFALAHYRLAVLCEWAGMYALAEAAAAQAVAHCARLSISDRRLLTAFQAYLAGDAARAELLYREILDIYPSSTEAWSHLAKIGYFLYSLRGRRLAGARTALERAAALDPHDIVIQVHLASVAAKEGRPVEVDAASRRVLAMLEQGDHADSVLIVRLQRAFATGDVAEQEQLWRQLETANDVTLFWSFTLLTVVVGALEAAERVARLMTYASRPRLVRLCGHLALAELELAHGRWSAAREELHAAARLDARCAAVHHALLALVHFRDPGPEELRALRDGLLAVRDDAPPAAEATGLPPCFTAYAEALDASGTYVLGLLHVHLDEREGAERCAAALEATTGSLARGAHARDAARGIRALLASRRGDLSAALALLEGCELASPVHLYTSTALHGRLHERYLRAELLGTLGRDAEAEDWYAALGEDSPHGFVYLAPSLLRRAELLEGRGEHAAALELHARHTALWQGCDAELQPLPYTSR